MNFLIDLLPVLVLFIIYKVTGDMFVATAAAIAASVLQMLLLKLRKMPIKPIHWFGFFSILVLGSLTIYLHDPFYLKLKFTIVEWVTAAIILVGQYVFRKNMLKSIIGTELNLPDEVWNKLGLRMGVFFVFLGLLNLMVMYYYLDNDDAWMNFKMYGVTVLMFVFFAFQSRLISPYIEDENKNDLGGRS